jgi:hypothetical protein
MMITGCDLSGSNPDMAAPGASEGVFAHSGAQCQVVSAGEVLQVMCCCQPQKHVMKEYGSRHVGQLQGFCQVGHLLTPEAPEAPEAYSALKQALPLCYGCLVW